MKTMILAAITVISLGNGAFADPLEGIWETTHDDNGHYGHIQVAPCGAALCGTLVKSFNGSGSEANSDLTGTQIISDTVAQSGGEYRGKIYAPDRDKTYNSRLQLSGDTLSVSGCVLGICRDGGTWTRLQ